MSPEQIAGSTVTGLSDVYSLAALIGGPLVIAGGLVLLVAGGRWDAPLEAS